jgi:fructose-1,6-bisphosphatase/inositol monophosphatase family enzyme
MAPAIDIMALADILREAAKAEVLPRFRRLDPSMVRQKTEAIDLVTDADVGAERFIRGKIAELMPEALFVGEESVAADPQLLERFDRSDLAIVVDPVDGTANFTAGLPLYAVMLAMVRGGEVVAGIIYDPMGDDWVLAEQGSGAWLRRPDGSSLKLSVTTPPRLEQMVGTVSVAFLPQEHKAHVLSNLAKIRVAANYRVAGHDYRLLATGNTHFAMFNKLMPWDHLPGTLIAREAGAHVARFDRSQYRPHHRDGGLLLAGSREAWEVLRREVFTF